MFSRIRAIPEYRFVSTTLLTTVISLTMILAAAILVDPYGIFGLRLIEPLVMTNRDEKLASLHSMSPPPQVIVLGSSRVFLMDPDRIEELTGLPAFNASVSYARPEDYLAMTRYVVEKMRIIPKMIIIGVNVGELNHDPIDPQTITNPDLNRYLPISPKEKIVTILKVFKERFNPRMVRDIGVALFYRARGYPEERVTFLPNGLQKFDRTAPPEADKIERTLNTAVRLFTGETELSKEREQFFSDFVSFAEIQGIEIRLAVLPMPPIVVAELERTTRYAELRNELFIFLQEQSAAHPNLRVFDTTDLALYGGNDLNFNDATHPGPKNIDLITDYILR